MFQISQQLTWFQLLLKVKIPSKSAINHPGQMQSYRVHSAEDKQLELTAKYEEQTICICVSEYLGIWVSGW